MSLPDPAEIARKVAESLAAYDAKVAVCPVRGRGRIPKVCPKCGATARDQCGVDASASHSFIEAVRQHLLESQQ